MGPVGYFIAILGCYEGGSACEQVATVATPYESRSACIAATGEALIANSDLDFPTLLAECRPVKARPSSTVQPDKLPEGTLRA